MMSSGRAFNIVQVSLGVAVILVSELVHQHLLVLGLAAAILVLGVGRELWDQHRERAALAQLELETGDWLLVAGRQG